MKNNRKGFTLIEMLVVVAIVGLLSSVVVVGVGGARQKARDAKRVSDVRQIQTWFESNYTTAYQLPGAGAAVPTTDPSGDDYAYCVINSGQGYAVGTLLEDAGNRPQGGFAGTVNCSSGTWSTDVGACTNIATSRTYCITSD